MVIAAAPRAFNVLFLCTGNSARSIVAESMLNSIGRPKFKAYSAGSQPAGRVNPFALEHLAANLLPTDGLRSKSWHEFAQDDAPPMDFVITVCDNANERCPVFPGKVHRIHWSFDDPAAVEGDEQEKLEVFRRVRDEIQQRLRSFVAAALD